MKTCVLLSVLLALGCVRGAPVEQVTMEQGSCDDASAKAAAELALNKINRHRNEGYIFGLHRLSNVHMMPHGEAGMVFYLTMDVLDTNCSVLSRKDFKSCEKRDFAQQPVYGQCKAAIYISKVHRVVRLYKYDCTVRPASAEKISAMCPDCPMRVGMDSQQIQKLVSVSLANFNKKHGLANQFALLNITRATAGMAMGMYYHAEYTIQETTCKSSDTAADNCAIMDCEFAHKGFCKASSYNTPTGEQSEVECEIYEPEAAEREKEQHLLGGETDHSHQQVVQSHDHDHTHLHGHEHHHDQENRSAPHVSLEGMVRMLPPMDQPMTLPSFPDVPAGPEVGVTLPLKPDPQIPGVMEPTIEAFPTSLSAQCPFPVEDETPENKLFLEDPMFKLSVAS